MSESESVAVGCKVDQNKRKRLRMLAARRDTTMSALLREEIDELLNSDDAPDAEDIEPHIPN